MILVVEDNSQLSEALAEFLAIHGHAVQTAANGADALGLLASSESQPALILLDLAMPVLDGWGFLDELNRSQKLANVPVVIMSGYRNVAQRVKESGAVAVVHKPVEPQTLLRIVDRYRH